MNNRILAFRAAFVPRTNRARRVAEVVFVAVVTSTLWMVLSYCSPCVIIPVSANNYTVRGGGLVAVVTNTLWMVLSYCIPDCVIIPVVPNDITVEGGYGVRGTGYGPDLGSSRSLGPG